MLTAIGARDVLGGGPLVTVELADVLLRERLSSQQRLGVMAAIGRMATIAAGR